MLCLALCLLGLSLSATAQEFFIVIPFDPPGSTYTFPSGIISGGTIVGYYQDANNVWHSFLRAPNGRFTRIDNPEPGTEGTLAYGMNPQGAITGQYADSTGRWHGFLRDPHGNFTRIDGPTSGLCYAVDTEANSINPAGWIAGDFQDSCNGAWHGFLRDPAGNITEFDAPDACSDCIDQGTWSAYFSGINPQGAITGWYTDSYGNEGGYVRTPGPSGNVTDFNISGCPQSYGAAINPGTAINPVGAIAGACMDASGVWSGFLRSPNDTYTFFKVPHAGTAYSQGTYPEDLNPSGAIVGDYYDSRGVSHGFLRSPKGWITTFDAPRAPNGTYPYVNNPEGWIAGYYYDAHNVCHGFLAIPLP
jgi:hypothetical protein